MFRAMSSNIKTVSRILSNNGQGPSDNGSGSAGGLMIIDDVLAQNVVEKTPFSELSFSRTLKFSSFGILLGPVIGYALQHGINFWQPTLHKQVSLEQLVFAPVFLPIYLL